MGDESGEKWRFDKGCICVSKNEQIEEVELNSAQLSALLHSKQV